MNPSIAQRIFSWLALACALLVPVLLAFAVVAVSGRGSPLPIVLDVLLAAAAIVWAIGIAARRHLFFAMVCVLESLAFCAFVATYFAAPLPAQRAYAGELPDASPPPSMRAYRMLTGVNHRTAAFGYRGGAFSDRREFAMTSVLLCHPKGDVLIDTGFGRRVAAHFASMPLGFQLVTAYEVVRSAAEQLDAAHYDRTRLRAVLLTHAHWDHTSGLSDFPGVPVLVPQAERRFIAESGFLGATARESAAHFETYTFDGGPYLGFPASHDVYRDGSIVVVPAPGHTPGSVIVFVTLFGNRRYAFVGDLAWQLEGVTEREERPWLVRTLGDDDPAAVRQNLLRMAALHARFPELQLVPAHDPRAITSLDTLPPRFESMKPSGA